MAAQSVRMIFIALLLLITTSVDSFSQTCYNLNFENGFTGWTGTASLGAGTLTPAFPAYNRHVLVPAPLNFGGGPTQNTTTNGNVDNQVSPLSSLAPAGGANSGRLGCKGPGLNKSYMQNTFVVTAANPIVTYQFALVFEDLRSGASHTQAQLSWFDAGIYDSNNNLIQCSHYHADQSTYLAANGVTTLDNFQEYLDPNSGYNYLWRDWDAITVDLTPYIGQSVTIKYETIACSYGEHNVWAYLDGYCSSNTPTTPIDICQGETTTLDAPGGYTTYDWQPGGATTEDYTTGTAGTYTVVAEDANGCSITQTYTVNVNPSPAVLANPTNVNICEGETTTLTVSSPNGVGMNYVWTPTTGLNPTTGTSVDASPTGNITYTVTGTDQNGCTGTSTVEVAVGSIPVPQAGPNSAICPGETVTLTATGGGTYDWAPNTGLNTTTGPTVDASPAATTTYTVTVTSIAGCTATTTVTVSVGNNLSLNVGPDVTICPGESTQLNATSDLGVTFVWTPAATLDDPNISNPTATPGTTTTYTVNASNGGCTNTGTVTVTVPTQVVLNTTPTHVTCNAACDGEIDLTVNGGDAPYTYVWTNGAGNNEDPVGLCPGTYSVVVTDNNGCTATDNETITEPTALTAPTSSTPAGCTVNDGTATVTLGGGTPNYIIDWQPGGQSTTTANNLGTGNYTVTVTDQNGCTIISTVNVGQLSTVAATITGSTNATCNGACDGTATVSGSGGNTPYTYSWSNGAGNITTPNNLCAGTHTVSVTDANGCINTTTVDITEPTPVTLNAPAVPVICLGQSAQLSATANGGTPAYTYNWMPGSLTGSPVNVSPTTQTIYTVTVTDANGCTAAPQTVTVNVNPPLAVDVANPNPVCVGNSVNIFASASGGDGNYTYSWDPGALMGASQTVAPATTTVYTVTVTDGCGTTPAVATVTVTIAQPPAITFTSTDPDGCAPWCVTFTNTTANVTSITWTFGDGSSSTTPDPSYCWKTAGSYDIGITITDANGCTNTLMNPGYVNVYANPIAEFTTDPQPASVLNPEVNFIDLSTGATVYHWHFGDGDSLVGSDNGPRHTYITENGGIFTAWLMVENQYGCWDTVSHPVEIKPDWSIYFPNTFTPNGDNRNDFFVGEGYGINEYEMWIYDRWGNEIYHCTSINEPWTGKVQNGASNEIAQIDTYVWVAQVTDVFNKRHRYIGHVNILK